MSDNQDDTLALQQIFDELLEHDSDVGHKEILILGRYRHDIQRMINPHADIKVDPKREEITYSSRTVSETNRSLQAKFMTVHKSKGLEADIVILLNCNSGKFGFPSEISDDSVLNLLLSAADQFENGEERRLFYVAMTRAKEKLFFVTDWSFKSKFIQELELETGTSQRKKCPNCKGGDVVFRKEGIARTGNKYRFMGCSNYVYGCGYTTTEWINS